jgi:hypothetical protein
LSKVNVKQQRNQCWKIENAHLKNNVVEKPNNETLSEECKDREQNHDYRCIAPGLDFLFGLQEINSQKRKLCGYCSSHLSGMS